MDGQLLVTQRRQSAADVDGPGHGAQAEVVVVDEHSQRGGRDGVVA